MAIDQDRPRARVLAFFSRTSNAVIAALATIAAALIAALGVTQHRESASDTRVVQLQSMLDGRTREAEQAKADAAAKERENLQLRLALAAAREQLVAERAARWGEPAAAETASVDMTTEAIGGTAEPHQTVVTKETQGFTIRLDGCRRSGTSVTCSFVATNNEKEQWLAFYAHGHGEASRAIDAEGNVYYAEEAALGPDVSTSAETTMPGGIPIRGWLRFREVPATMTSFTLLQLTIGARSGTYKIDYHRVAIAA